MDLLLKQRLVGAAVIISLGVVIIPMLLDGSGNRIIQEIPPRPDRQGVEKDGLVKYQNIPSLPRKKEGEVVYNSEPVPSKPKTSPTIRKAPAPTVKSVPVKTAKKAAVKKKVAQKTERLKASAEKIEAGKVQASKMPVLKTTQAPDKSQVSEVPVSSSLVTKSISTQKLASWVVQVGSFSEKSKAINLRDQIRLKGFAVFMEHFKNSEEKQHVSGQGGSDPEP